MERRPIEVVEDALRQAGHEGKMVSGQLMVTCPAHNDRSPSLAVKEGDNGNVLMTCHAGCDTRDVVAELGLEMSDLFAEEPDREKNKTVVAVYQYVDPFTTEVAWEKVRYFPKTFIQRHYDRAGKEVYGLPKDVKPWLYHAPELKKGLDNGEPIWLVEGEADVHAIERMGGVATTQTMGAGKGKWLSWHTHMLKRAKDVRIVVDLDDDRKNARGETINPGRDYALEVRDALKAEGIPVSLWHSPVGKDASDALHAGKTLADFVKYPMPRIRPEGTMGDELMAKVFPPLIFAVEDILPQGVAILGAPPKAAKSFMTLDMALGVATGGMCLGGIKCTKGDVLYIGLEDSERRIQDRIQLLCEGQVPDMSRIEFHSIDTGWEGGVTGMAGMADWAEGAEDPRLVIIDTLGKAEPELSQSKDSYRAEQEMMLRYKRFADRYDLSLLFVHHDRKSADDDWLNKFSGTKGLTGGADTLLYIDFKRGEREGTLRVDGRDVKGDDLSMHKVHGRPFWRVIKAPESIETMPDTEAAITPTQRAILGRLRGVGPMSKIDLTRHFKGTDIEPDIARLESDGLITWTSIGYSAVKA